jgi:hypothetical protein
LNTRVDKLYEVDFSTIKLKDNSQSKFISQEAINELIQPVNDSIFWNEEKIQCQKKRKLEI